MSPPAARLREALRPALVRVVRRGRLVRLALARRPAPAPRAGGPALSPDVQAFVDELPGERAGIAAFIAERAGEIAPGSRVLDAGAGDSPYRTLFAHCRYVTTDWSHSVHEGAHGADIVASLDDLPIDDEGFDAVICTQVLEHVVDPPAVMRELARVLRPGGELWLTAPLVWPLHEEPHDFYRFTSHGLRALCERAGLEVLELEARNGFFTTLAQLCQTAGWALGRPDDDRRRERRAIVLALRELARVLGAYDELDSRRILPLGYALRARRRA